MKLFACPNCGNRIYFENAQCLKCMAQVVYRPESANFTAYSDGEAVYCANATECGCNWAASPGGMFCLACSLNQTIPDLSVEGNRDRWRRVEGAKKRAIYSLLAFGLEVAPKEVQDDEIGLAFDLLADPIGAGPGGERILTGHDNGLITLNVAEADGPVRERMRVEMGEAYRTLLGHFRHELGHYYWDRLVRDDSAWHERFRAVFGDETIDYATALQNHYAQGSPADWQERHISAYAASHPWEDWAESFAHYLHITDTLEMVAALNFPLGRLDAPGARDLPPNEANYSDRGTARAAEPADLLPGDFDEILARWLVLSEASNSINRCMGLPDLYPFVIAEQTAEKLRFVHELLAEQRRRPD